MPKSSSEIFQLYGMPDIPACGATDMRKGFDGLACAGDGAKFRRVEQSGAGNDGTPPSQRRGQLCRRHSHQRMQSGGQGHVRCDGHIRPRRARALALVLWRTRQPILGTSLAYRLRALHPRRRQSRTCRFWRYGRCSQPLGHAGRIDRWVPKLDAYLAARGLPHLAIYPEYMPPPRPPTTNYAALDFMVSPHLAGAALPGRDLSRPFPACP